MSARHALSAVFQQRQVGGAGRDLGVLAQGLRQRSGLFLQPGGVVLAGHKGSQLLTGLREGLVGDFLALGSQRSAGGHAPAGTVLEADDSITLGGLKGANPAKGVAADDTLEARLEAQHDWFLENAGLEINI